MGRKEVLIDRVEDKLSCWRGVMIGSLFQERQSIAEEYF